MDRWKMSLSVIKKTKWRIWRIFRAPKNAYSRKLRLLKINCIKVKNIFETDDDNFPYSTFKEQLNSKLLSFESLESDFPIGPIFMDTIDQKIWLEVFLRTSYLKIKNQLKYFVDINQISITQFLADGDSDVDAIYRLVSNEFVNFKRDKEAIKRNSYCPFNSQTLYGTKVFPPNVYSKFCKFQNVWYLALFYSFKVYTWAK